MSNCPKCEGQVVARVTDDETEVRARCLSTTCGIKFTITLADLKK